MSDRRAQIVALYATRNDHLPGIRHHALSSSGFVHDTWAPTVCPTCDGLDRHCADCRGRGSIEVRRHRDPYAQARVVAYGLDGEPHDRFVALDRAVALAGQELRRFPGFRPASLADEVADLNEHPERWEAERRRMYRRFDYAALDRCLERLAARDVPAMSDHGLELLDRWLPDPLRAPVPDVPAVLNVAAKGRGADRRALDQRDRAVLELHAAGHGWDEIALRVGLSVRQLRRIVNTQKSEAA